MRNLLGRARISRLCSTLLSRRISVCPNLNKSHYETLDVPTSASKKDIRNAYIQKSKLYHPDHDPSDPSLHAKFVAIQEAYDILSSDTKRKEYDSGVTNFRNHPRSSANYQHSQAPGWGQYSSSKDDPFKEKEKSRAFWTDPNYHKRRSPSDRKTRIFGREYDAKDTNKLIVLASFLWMTFGTAFVYIYVKYIYGQREVVLMDRQKKLAAQYNATREEARLRTNKEVADAFMKKVHGDDKGKGE